MTVDGSCVVWVGQGVCNDLCLVWLLNDRSCVVWVGQGVCNDLCPVWLLTDRASSGSGKVCVMIYALCGC